MKLLHANFQGTPCLKKISPLREKHILSFPFCPGNHDLLNIAMFISIEEEIAEIFLIQVTPSHLKSILLFSHLFDFITHKILRKFAAAVTNFSGAHLIP